MKNHEFTKIYVQLRLPEAHGEPCATEEALGAGVREPVTSEEAQLAPRVLAHGYVSRRREPCTTEEALGAGVREPVTPHGEPCATEEALGAGVREPVTSEEAQLAPRVLAHEFHASQFNFQL
eukprot:g4052.t1